MRVAMDPVIAHEHRRYLSAPSCPNCGTLVACGEASEYISDGASATGGCAKIAIRVFAPVIKICG